MNRARIPALILLSLALSPIAGRTAAADGPPSPNVPTDLPKDPAAAAERGRADAAAHLAAKKGFYYVGGPPLAHVLQLRDVMREDRGLTVVALGCIISSAGAEYTTAYNAAIGAALAPKAEPDKAFEPEHRKAIERWERDRAASKKRPAE